QGNLNFNGTDTLTVTSADGNGSTDTDSVGITVGAVNNAPVNTVPGAQSVNEDTLLNLSGISINDVDGNLSTVQLAVGNGTLNVTLSGTASISGGANGTNTLTLSGSQADINATLASLSYQGTLHYNGADTLTVTSTDGNAVTDVDAVAIAVTAVNDTPTDLTLSANTVAENAVNGTVVGTITGTDPDSGDTKTYSFTDSAGGRFAIDSSTGIITVANGSLLNYEAATNHSVTVRVTDSGGLAYDETFTINLTNVNEAPTGADATVTLNEDTAHTLTTASFGFIDVDAENILSAVRIDSVPGAGTLTLSGGAVTAGQVITVADITVGNLVFTPAAHANGTGYASLTFSVRDSNNAYDATPNTLTFNVTAVNDAPVNTAPGAQTVNEDTLLNLSGISINDVDGNLSTVQLAVGNGTLNVTLSGAASISSGASGTNTLTLSGSQADINATLATLSYQGNLNFNGTDTLTVTSTDGNGSTDTDSVGITVGAVNNTPVNTVPGAQTVNEDTLLNLSGISVNDVDGNLSTVQLAVASGTLTVTLSGAASISAGANGSNTMTLSGSQAGINATLTTLSYQGNLNFNGTDTLTVTSTDANGASNMDSVAITVNTVNDAPANTVPGAQTVNEDTSLAIGGISVNDVDGNLSTVQLTVGNGTLTVTLSGATTISAGANGSNALTLSGSQVGINATLASLSYQGNLNFNGADTLTVTSTDANSASNVDSVAITVNTVNDAPVNTAPKTQTIAGATLPLSGISVTDVDSNLSTVQLAVINGTLTVTLSGAATISAGANGTNTLTLSGTQTDVNATLASLVYQGSLNANATDTLTIFSTDSNGASDHDTTTLNFTAGDAAPINTVPGALSIIENTLTAIGGIRVTDADENLATVTLTVSHGTLNVILLGGTTVSAGANGSNTLTLSGTQTDINTTLASLSYRNNPGYLGTDTLMVISTDSNGASDHDTLSMTVNSAHQAPVGTNDHYALVQNATLIVAAPGVLMNDSDAGESPLTALLIDNPAHGAVVFNSDGSFTYTPDTNFTGTDSFTYIVSAGDTVSRPVTVLLTVNPTALPLPAPPHPTHCNYTARIATASGADCTARDHQSTGGDDHDTIDTGDLANSNAAFATGCKLGCFRQCINTATFEPSDGFICSGK
ncbi:MAG: tandem-95 repeat protein, partial [Nitrosomonas sp.]